MARKTSKKRERSEAPRRNSILRRSFRLVLGNWKLFFGIFAIMAIIELLVVGLPSVETSPILGLILTITWLTTIYLTRRLEAGRKVTLREGFYNSMTSFVPSVLVWLVVAIESLPIITLIVLYPTAVETGLFSNFGYGFGFVLFALAMVGLTWYLLPVSVMALVAVSAPGLYPIKTLSQVSELMKGRRAEFWLKLLVAVVVMVVVSVAIAVPMIGLAQFIDGTGIITQSVIAVLECLATIWLAVYLYLYYRELVIQ